MSTESYTLLKTMTLRGTQFLPGDEVTFDGDEICIRNTSFLGFRDPKGRLRVFTDGTCSQSADLEVTLHPKFLVGHVIRKIVGMELAGEKVTIDTDRGRLTMRHVPICCEQVELLDVVGDSKDLIGGTIVTFEVRSGVTPYPGRKFLHGNEPPSTWRAYTFYEIRTTKGDVTLRWGEPDDLDNNRYGEGISLSWKDA